MNDTPKKIKEVRLKAGLSQESFGKSLGFSKAYVANIETGRTKPSRRFLEAISEHYAVSVDWVLLRNRLLYLIEVGVPELYFVYGFTQEEINNCEIMLKQLLTGKTYIFVDALNLRSTNLLISKILNEKGTTERLMMKLRYKAATEQLILIIKNMSLSKIRYSDGLIWSFFNVLKDAPPGTVRKTSIGETYQVPGGALIILDYPSYLEKNIHSFGQDAIPISAFEIQRL